MEVIWDFFPGDKTESNHFGIPYFSVIIFNSKTGLNRNRTTADSGLVVDSVKIGESNTVKTNLPTYEGL